MLRRIGAVCRYAAALGWRSNDNPADSIAAIDRILDMITGWPALNEFKYTQLPQ